MTSTIPALVLAKMRPNTLASGREADYFRTLELILEQIQGQTGVFIGEVTDPRIDALEDDVDTLEIDVDAIEVRVDELEADITIQNVSSNITAVGDVLLNITASCEITLNPSPNNGERVIAYHAGSDRFNVAITDGAGSDIIFLPQTIISYQYSSVLSKWVRGL